MTTTSHRDCTHPATKAARAKCRKARAAAAAYRAEVLDSCRMAYLLEDADLEEIAGRVAQVDPELARGYYDDSLDAEEFIASLA
jgi:hypothetical protein